MKTYRRILVPIFTGGQSDILLHRVTELAKVSRMQMLVVHVLDTRSGIPSDGPAGALPGEMAARRAPEAMKRLELQLARNNLGWAEAKVVWGEPNVLLADIIRDWAPDLIVTCGQLPQGIVQGPDILTVGCRNLFRRLAQTLQQGVPRHA